jgi:hypothetical protein
VDAIVFAIASESLHVETEAFDQRHRERAMPIGPLEFVVIAFPGGGVFRGEIAEELSRLVEHGAIRIVDLAFVRKEDDTIELMESSDLDDAEFELYSGLLGDIAGLLTPDDLVELAALAPPRSTAAVVLLEHVWATGLQEAVGRAGGRVVARERISGAALEDVARELSMANH